MTFSEPITDLGDDAVDPALGNGFADLVDRPTRLRAASSPEWSTVTLSTAQAGGGWDFAVRNATSGTEHVVGTIRPR